MDIAEVLLASSRFPVREAALAFATAGLPVFPCAANGKRPLTVSGFHDASSDIGQVRAWWSRWPRANIGVPTGRTSGIDVVDIDVKSVGAGFAAIERAHAAGLVEGELARVRTPSGGMHVYFPASETRPQRCWQAAAAHVDFRGEGGYIVVPPSNLMAAGERVGYRLCAVSTARSQPLDAVALRNFIDPRPMQAKAPTTGFVAPEPTRLAQWVSRLREGERNAGLFWAACRLVEAGFEPAAVESALGTAAQTAGLAEQEITATINSASRRASAAGSSPRARLSAPEPSPPRRSEAPFLTV